MKSSPRNDAWNEIIEYLTKADQFGYTLRRTNNPGFGPHKGDSMTDTAALNIKDGTANPAPLGLFGFGMTTVLLNLHNAGIIGLSSVILAMGICYGGAAQVIAGIMEWKKNNTFGTTAFTSYGFFWLSLVALLILPKIDPKWAPDDSAMACYLGIWGLFTFGLLIATFRLSVALQVV